jgi:Metallopeptidase toxin 3
MKLTADDQIAFPQLASYLRREMPLLIGNSTITSNLRRFGSMDLSQARSALMWDTEPLVTVTDLSSGCTRDTTHIEVDDDIVAEFEANPQTNLRTTAFGRRVFLTGVCLLHEMCHWGNFVNGAAEPAGTDAGTQFENAVYGGPVPD